MVLPNPQTRLVAIVA
jgi:hypothetical protein